MVIGQLIKTSRQFHAVEVGGQQEQAGVLPGEVVRARAEGIVLSDRTAGIRDQGHQIRADEVPRVVHVLAAVDDTGADFAAVERERILDQTRDGQVRRVDLPPDLFQ